MAGIVIEYTDTFTRSSSASVRDYQGNYVTVPTDVRRYQGARWDGTEWHNTDLAGNPISGIKLLLEDGATEFGGTGADPEEFEPIGDVTFSDAGNILGIPAVFVTGTTSWNGIGVRHNVSTDGVGDTRYVQFYWDASDPAADKLQFSFRDSTSGAIASVTISQEGDAEPFASPTGFSPFVDVIATGTPKLWLIRASHVVAASGVGSGPSFRYQAQVGSNWATNVLRITGMNVTDTPWSSWIMSTGGSTMTRNPESLTYADLPEPNKVTFGDVDTYDWDGSVPLGEHTGFCVEAPDTDVTTASLSIAADNGDGATITVVTRDASAYSIDWGDGNTTTGVASDASTSHTYAADTTGTVTITAASPIEEIVCAGTGDVWAVQCTELPRALLALDVDDGALIGTAAELPSGMTYINLFSTDSVVTGDTSDLPRGLTYLSLANTDGMLIGDVGDLPRELAFMNLSSTDSAITGNSSDLPSKLAFMNLSSTDSTVAGSSFWKTSVQYVDLRANTGMTAAEVDNWIVALSGVTTWVGSSTHVRLDAFNDAPTAASADALALIQSRGGIVVVNS